MIVQPYAMFQGKCDEAIEFYKKALDAHSVTVMRFKDNPDPPPGGTPPEMQDKVMHAEMKIGETTIMLSDGMCTGKLGVVNMVLTISVADDAEAQKRFKALSEGGEIRQPLIKTFFATSFGMLTDKFGVGWMILARAKP